MPELPEVETIARGLRAQLVGERIAAAEVRHPAVLATPATELAPMGSGLADLLCAARIQEVSRVGKFLVLGLSREGKRLALVIHLGMTGQLTVNAATEPVGKHTHVQFLLDGRGRELRYRDIRRFGRIRVLDLEDLPNFFAHLGPDPFEVSVEELSERLRGRKAPIKNLLLNQTILRGLGNIYADESLFAARIHPQRRAGRLTREEIARLLRAIRRVLARAIAHCGSSVSNYLTAEGRAGDYQRYHRVYQRLGRPCPRCGTAIARLVLAGRSSHFCPRCQVRSNRTQPRSFRGRSRRDRENSRRRRVNQLATPEATIHG